MSETKIITASYPFTLENVLPGWELHQKCAGMVNRLVFWILGGALVFMGLLAMILGSFLAALAPLAIGGVCLYVPVMVARSMRGHFEQRQKDGATMEARFSEESVTVLHMKSETVTKWEALHLAVLTKEGLLLYTGKYDYVWFPRSAFPSREDYEACVALAERKTKDIKRM